MISGSYKVPIVNKYTGQKENMNLIIESDCEFMATSPSTGTSVGNLYANGDGTYNGTGTNDYCPSGKFAVFKSSNGYFNSNCILKRAMGIDGA